MLVSLSFCVEEVQHLNERSPAKPFSFSDACDQLSRHVSSLDGTGLLNPPRLGWINPFSLDQIHSAAACVLENGTVVKTGPAIRQRQIPARSAAGWHGGGALKDGSGSHQMAFIYIKPSRWRNNTSGLNATRSNTALKQASKSEPACRVAD